MNFSKFILISIFIVLTSLSLIVLADDEKSLADLVKERAENSKNSAQNSQSTAEVPGYSEEDKQEIEKKLGAIRVGVQVDHLKTEGENIRKSEIKNNPDGAISTMSEATDFKRVKGFEGYSELQIFTESDKYMQDPIGQMSLIKDKGCVEKINNKKKGFFRKEKKETITDIIEEIRSCEVPVSNLKCNKILEVTCKKTAECDYGGITKDSIDSQMLFDVKNGFFTVGVDCDNCLSGYCSIHKRIIIFSMSQIDLVTSFYLSHVKFDDYLQLTLNGHVVYVGPDGGDYLEVKRGSVYNGKFRRGCERGKNWDVQLNRDLKPFLLEGKNTLEMKIIVSGYGEGWLQIKAKKQCCENDDWQENWVEHCEQTS